MNMFLTEKWLDRGRKAFNAAVVVVCYLLVFAGIVYSMVTG